MTHCCLFKVFLFHPFLLPSLKASATVTVKNNAARVDTAGLAVAGGYIFPAISTEVWSPSFNCSLPPLLRDMYSPTLDLFNGSLFACFGSSCVILTEDGWQEGPVLIQSRSAHTSAVTSQV